MNLLKLLLVFLLVISASGHLLPATSGNFRIVDDVIIPSKTTTYWCSLHQLPVDANKLHVTGYSQYFNPPQNQHLIHHMEIFVCKGGIIKPTDSYRGDCAAFPKHFKCNHVISAWASGAAPVVYPPEAGMLLSRGEYFRLEIHYNNPQHVSNTRDQSGFQLHYTTQLRPYNIGIMEVGSIYTPVAGIPPKQEEFVWRGVCPAVCTKKGIPRTGIKLIYGQLHSHLAGNRMKLSVTRKGVSRDLLVDNHYTTWVEPIRPISPPMQIFPGDEIVTSCYYNTSQRNETTLGGLGIYDEMCVTYLHYYPASNLEVCKTSPSYRALQALALFITGNETISKSSIRTMMNRLDLAKMFQKFYNRTPLDVHCYDNTGQNFSGKWKDLYPAELN